MSVSLRGKPPSTGAERSVAHERLQTQLNDAEAVDRSRKSLVSGTSLLSKAIFSKPDPGSAGYFSKKAAQLINNYSFAKIGSETKCVDIVKDVINYLPVHWISHLVSCLASARRSLITDIASSVCH